MNTNFKVIGLIRLGIKPKSTAPAADALTSELFKVALSIFKHCEFVVRQCKLCNSPVSYKQNSSE